MEALERLLLFDNQLEGQLPASWGAMPRITLLALQHNRLHGMLPSSWSALGGQLALLNISWNCFHGQMPSTWSMLLDVSTVDACRSGISDSRTTAQRGYFCSSLLVDHVNCPPSVTESPQYLSRSMAPSASFTRPVQGAQGAAPRSLLQRATVGVMSSASVASAAVSPSSALTLRRVVAILSLGQCDALQQLDEAMDSSDAPDFLDEPLQFPVGAAQRGAVQRGIVVGNLVLLAALTLCCLVGVFGHHTWLKTKSIASSAASVGLPGSLMSVVALVLQPTVSASTLLVTTTLTTAADAATGVIGIVFIPFVKETLTLTIIPKRVFHSNALSLAFSPDVSVNRCCLRLSQVNNHLICSPPFLFLH